MTVAVTLEMHAVCVGRDQHLCCLLFPPRHQHVCAFIQAKCSKCHSTFSLTSSPCCSTKEGKKFWTINLGAVLGQIATGGGVTHLQKIMATTGVPSMLKPTFIATERYLMEKMKCLLCEMMMETGRNEHDHAIATQSFFQGVPAIKSNSGWWVVEEKP